MQPTHVRLTIPDSVEPVAVTGPADALLRRIDDAFEAIVTVRGNQVSVIGPAEVVEQVTSVFSRIISRLESGEPLGVADVDFIVEQVRHGVPDVQSTAEDILLTHRGRTVRPKTEGQKRYVEAIRGHKITFGIGPAGTGKTYLAMAMAVAALKRHEVARIVLTRPVVEAGESLGYLPGTLQEKLDPYVRPLYDALFDMTDAERATAMIEQGVIEISPLAFIRGRTFNDSFVILDEAQNSTPEQMKMFLTRLGLSSTFVVTGDASQRDLLGRSGIDSAREILRDVDEIAFIDLGRDDIVRHSLVAKIVEAYEQADKRHASGKDFHGDFDY